MEDKKSKNILMVNGILHGHFTGSVELVKELLALGHKVTCYVLDEFEERIKDVGAKIVVYHVDKNALKKEIPPGAPSAALVSIVFGRAYDQIFTLLSKDDSKYDYYIFDSFFDVKEMNKVLKYPLEKYIIYCSGPIFTDQDLTDPGRRKGLEYANKKYNIELHDIVQTHYIPNQFKKLIFTTKLFHLRSEQADETCYFTGPFIEKRKIDENFKFTKDKNKKLIYISLGTIFNEQEKFYSNCIEAFKDSPEYQVVLSVGKSMDINKFKDAPKNFSIFSYVPQTQLLPDVDIFITHGGINSTQEGLSFGVPLIVIPQQYDQFDNAKRVEELEAGIALDRNKIEITVDVLKDAVNKINTNREKYKKGIERILQSYKEARDNRKNIYGKIFV
jgi:MGT family glycosyltransferase